MAEAVLDASALIAFIRNEPGAEKAAAVLTASCISAVNLEETLRKMIQYGKQLEAMSYQIELLRIPVIPFDGEQACVASSMWKSMRPFGLSLGDRACLSLALKLSVPALTTERDWSKIDVGVRVEKIR